MQPNQKKLLIQLLYSFLRDGNSSNPLPPSPTTPKAHYYYFDRWISYSLLCILHRKLRKTQPVHFFSEKKLRLRGSTQDQEYCPPPASLIPSSFDSSQKTKQGKIRVMWWSMYIHTYYLHTNLTLFLPHFAHQHNIILLSLWQLLPFTLQ